MNQSAIRLVLISVLLSLALIASTSYLGNLQLQRSEISVQVSEKIKGTCMYLDIHPSEMYNLAQFYAQNDCQKPVKFSILYYYDYPQYQYTIQTSCLNQNEKSRIQIKYFGTIVEVTEEEC